jgi:hypothetical protein
MIPFPYSAEQRLSCFKRILMLATAGVGPWNTNHAATRLKMLSGKPDNRDRWVEISLATKKGAFTGGLVCLGALVDSFRSDLTRVLSAEACLLAKRDPFELMRRVREPRFIFEFQRLVDIFVFDLIPTQLLLNGSDLPKAFSPAELTYLGPE